jgi:hypothetical protein
MPSIWNGKLDVTPENLYLITEELADIYAERKFLWLKEFNISWGSVSNIENGKVVRGPRFINIMFENDRIGSISVRPLNPLTTWVSFNIEPFKDEMTGNIMRGLASVILGRLQIKELPSDEKLSEKIKLRRPGRPHLADDVWAWEQIYEGGRDIADVSIEWKNRPGVTARNLIDPARHFNKIKLLTWRNGDLKDEI